MAEKLWNDPKIWAGLNRPDIETKEADAVIFGIPFDGAVSFRAGAKEAPDALRGITYTISPTSEDFKNYDHLKIKDIGNMTGETKEDLFEKVAMTTQKLVEEESFFIMIGGDHSVTIPVQKGVNDALKENFGIVHIDAHFDLCDTQNGDPLSHASTERRAIELDNVSGIEDVYFMGIRSIESDEVDFYNNENVQVLTAKQISKLGAEESVARVKEQLGHLNKIYLTIDIDCLDPAFAAGTGTPQFGGLTSRELLTIVEGLFEMPIVGMDIVEVAPKLDPAWTSVFAARKLVQEVLGFIAD